MIRKVGQIMLYVDDQDKAVGFWTGNMGFQKVAEERNGEMRWIEIAPEAGSETTIILHNKDMIAKMSPGLNLETPSLMFFTDDLDQLYKDLSNRKVTVGEIVAMPSGRVFNFADDEGNYFAVMEKSK